MFDVDFDADLDLGSRRKPVEWVAIAPPVTVRNKQNPAKRNNGTRRQAPASSPQIVEVGSMQPEEDNSSTQKQRRPKYTEKPAELASGVHGRVAEVVMLEPEEDDGNVEYKLRLMQPNPVRFQQLVTQMQYRLSEGNGECFYYVGVEDDGYPRGLSRQDLQLSLATLKAMAEAVSAAVQPLCEMPASKGRAYLIVRVQRICLEELSYADLRIAVAGSVDSGKSTLVAVLTHGQKGRPLLDNGQGSARMNVLRHKHEIESGRTSSLSHHMLAYDADAGVLNYAGVAPLMPSEIAAAASKVLRFIDLGGHQKYLKTALYGMTSLLPDYVLLCVCPMTGLTRVTREHLAVALALELPLAVVLTKVDIAPPPAVASVLASIQQLLHAASAGQCVAGTHIEEEAQQLHFTVVGTESQAVELAKDATGTSVRSPRKVPVFSLASTTGAGLSVLHSFLSHLEPAYQPPKAQADKQECSKSGPVMSATFAPNIVLQIPDLPASEPSALGFNPEADNLAGPEGDDLHARTDASSPTLQRTRVLPADTAYQENRPAPTSASTLAAAGVPRPVKHSFPGGGGKAQSGGLSAQMADLGGHSGRKPAGRPGDSLPGAPAHFQVDQTFEVRGVGSVVSGTLVAGEIVLGQRLLLGPTAAGDFMPFTVTSIQRAQVPVKKIRVGQHATLAVHAAQLGSPKLNQEAAPSAHLDQHISSPSNTEGTTLGAMASVESGFFREGMVSGSKTDGTDDDSAKLVSQEASLKSDSAVEMSEAPAEQPSLSSSTDPRHDTWREAPPVNVQAGSIHQAPRPVHLQEGRLLDVKAKDFSSKIQPSRRDRNHSFGSDSDQGDSPRVALETELSHRLSAEEALNAFSALSLANEEPGFCIEGAQAAQQKLERQTTPKGQDMTGGPSASAPQETPAKRLPSVALAPVHLGVRAELGASEQPGGASDDDGLPAWAEHATHDAVSAHNSRKGTVLLDMALQPQAVWQFEAVMVLLSGFWPARGLLSGSWPPQLDSDAEAGCSDSSAPTDSPAASFDRLRSPPSRGTRHKHRAAYTPVVHCGSVRQAARVVSMAEVPLPEAWRIEDACRATGCDLAPAIAAAASLLAHPSGSEGQQDGESCIAVVTFRFTHRPEWIQEGARLVVRDRTESCTAGAGIVRSLWL